MGLLENVLSKEEYNFMKESSGQLKENICLLGLGGSHAYGTNVDGSDLDIRGVMLDSVDNIIGIKDNLEQIEDRTTDTVIYTMDKMYNLLSNCNPNVIEILGLRKQDYLYIDDIGQMLLDNKHIFLSKQAYDKFFGYAKGQLIRLENALVNRVNNGISSAEDAEKLLRYRIESKVSEYKRKYTGFDAEVYTDNGLVEINYTFNRLTRKKINHILNEIESIKTSLNDLGKRAGRAIKKGEDQIGKHAMHLVRLYFMCIDILEHREIITYREKERELLMNIRNGGMQKADGNFKQEFYTLIKELEIMMKASLERSKLPDRPCITQLGDLRKQINLETLKRYKAI